MRGNPLAAVEDLASGDARPNLLAQQLMRRALVTPARRLSDTTIAGTPPMNARARVCEPIQSDRPCVQVASA